MPRETVDGKGFIPEGLASADAATPKSAAVEQRHVLTSAEAISLLPAGDYVHNFAGGGILIGCDYSREQAIKALNEAAEIEIGGGACRAMRHPLAVWEPSGRVTFFEADMAKLEAFEAAALADGAGVAPPSDGGRDNGPNQ